MGIFERSRKNVKRFSQMIPLTFFKSYPGTEYQVKGMGTKHHLGIDPDTRTLVNSHNIQVSVCESLLNEIGYTTRDGNGACTLKNNFVKFTHWDGVLRSYKIIEVYPDDSLGLTVCTLSIIQ